jgi:exosome complex component CSL4
MSSQSSENPKNSQLVLPGERLGVIEEFIPNDGTYVKDGVIYSKVIGRKTVDFSNRHVSVQAVAHGAPIPKIGVTVMGQISNVQSDNAGLRIFAVDNRQLSGVFTGVLHISDVAMRYVEAMFDVCKAGDIVRATVISDKNKTYHLSTRDKELGVVYAFCTNCGHMLELRRQALHCPNCGRVEKRKTAEDYGK